MTDREESKSDGAEESILNSDGADLVKRFEEHSKDSVAFLAEMRQRALEFFQHVEEKIEDRHVYCCEYRGDGKLFMRFYPNEIFSKRFSRTLQRLKPEVDSALLGLAQEFDTPRLLDVVLDVRLLPKREDKQRFDKGLLVRIVSARMAARSAIYEEIEKPAQDIGKLN